MFTWLKATVSINWSCKKPADTSEDECYNDNLIVLHLYWKKISQIINVENISLLKNPQFTLVCMPP